VVHTNGDAVFGLLVAARNDVDGAITWAAEVMPAQWNVIVSDASFPIDAVVIPPGVVAATVRGPTAVAATEEETSSSGVCNTSSTSDRKNDDATTPGPCATARSAKAAEGEAEEKEV
jgi:hypothetical protein